MVEKSMLKLHFYAPTDRCQVVHEMDQDDLNEIVKWPHLWNV